MSEGAYLREVIRLHPDDRIAVRVYSDHLQEMQGCEGWPAMRRAVEYWWSVRHERDKDLICRIMTSRSVMRSYAYDRIYDYLSVRLYAIDSLRIELGCKPPRIDPPIRYADDVPAWSSDVIVGASWLLRYLKWYSPMAMDAFLFNLEHLTKL